MTRARELANFADDVAGLETLTVSDVTDLSVSASNINSATNQIIDSSTDLNVDSNTLVVDKSANRVGIGVTQPSQKLEISDSATVAMQIRNLTNSGYSQLVFGTGSSGSSFCMIRHERVGIDQGKIHITKPNDGSGGDAFTIDYNGKVGIGTTSPDELLHLKSSTSLNPILKIENTNADHLNAQINFIKNSASEADDDYLGQIDFEGLNDNDEMIVYGRLQSQAKDVSDGTEDGRVYISAMANGTLDQTFNVVSGNVGIGTTSPSARLSIEGSNNTLSEISLKNTSPNPDTHWKITPLYDSDTLAIRSVNNSHANRMTINGGGDVTIPSGKLGVGTTSPDANSTLDVRGEMVMGDGSGTAALKVHPSYMTDGGGGAIAMMYHASSSRWFLFGGNSQSAKDIWIGNGTNQTLYINSTGQIGAGTSTPSGGLHVYDDRDITNNPNDKGIRLDESAGRWLLSLGESGVSNTSFCIRDVANSKYPIRINPQTGANSTPSIDIYSDGRVRFEKPIYAQSLRTLFMGLNTTLTINPYTQLGQSGTGGCFYVSFSTWPGLAGLFQVRWRNAGGSGGITTSGYDTIVNGGGGSLGLSVSHAQNNNIYDTTISISTTGHHSNTHGFSGGVINFTHNSS